MPTTRFQYAFAAAGRTVAYLLLGLSALLLPQSCTQNSQADACHTKASQIYRVSLDRSTNGVTLPKGGSPNVVAPVATERVAGVESAVRLFQHGFGEPAFVKTSHAQQLEGSLYYADATLFEVFDFEFVSGDAPSALSQSDAVVLSESAARRYFGNQNPMGQTVHVDNIQHLRVTGVYRDQPANSSLRPDLIGALAANKWAVRHLNWEDTSYTTFLLLTPDADPSAVAATLQAEQAKSIGEEATQCNFSLLPLSDGGQYTTEQTAAADSRPSCYAAPVGKQGTAVSAVE